MNASNEILSNVSFVVIGLNEEKNLHNTFKAIQKIDYPKNKYEIIYIDTGSIDKSLQIAKEYTKYTFVEKSNWPTPGLARNKGLIESKYEIIHFIDGDIQINKEYIKKALKRIRDDNIHAVYGYLEEENKVGINNILLSHWHHKKQGFVNATGGGGTYLKRPLQLVNGYDERIRKGQETELGERYRNAGYNIYYLNIPMGIHDYGINKFRGLLNIFILDGKSKFMNYLITDTQNDFLKKNNKQLMKNILEMFVWSIILLGSILLHWILFPIFLAIYPAIIFIKYFFFRKIKSKNEILYFLIMNLAKPFTFLGTVLAFFIYHSNRLLRKKQPLIKCCYQDK